MVVASIAACLWADMRPYLPHPSYYLTNVPVWHTILAGIALAAAATLFGVWLFRPLQEKVAGTKWVLLSVCLVALACGMAWLNRDAIDLPEEYRPETRTKRLSEKVSRAVNGPGPERKEGSTGQGEPAK